MSRIRRVVMEIDEDTANVSCTFVSCCVSFDEMYEAVKMFRDKLDEQIRKRAACPMHPPLQH